MLLKLSKFFSLLLVVYIVWFKAAYGQIPYVLQFLTICMVYTLILHFLVNKRSFKFYNPFPKEFLWWIAFGFYALISGIFIAKDINFLIGSLSTYFSFLIVCIGFYFISKEDASIIWILRIQLITAILCAFNTIFLGYDYNNGIYVVTMGANNNPNTLGITMCFGIFSLLYLMDFEQKIKTVINILLLGVFSYVIILTGSRKAFLACALLIMLWLMFIQKERLKNISLLKKIYYVILISVVILISYDYFSTNFINSASFQRLENLFSGSNDTRVGLYKEAWDYFIHTPLLGLGYNQFRLYSSHGYYSHSTYAEVLSGTGIIGIFLYFIPYVMAMYKLTKNLFIPYITNEEKYNFKMWLSLLLMMMFLGVGVIHFYNINTMLIMASIFIFLSLNNVVRSSSLNDPNFKN